MLNRAKSELDSPLGGAQLSSVVDPQNENFAFHKGVVDHVAKFAELYLKFSQPRSICNWRASLGSFCQALSSLDDSLQSLGSGIWIVVLEKLMLPTKIGKSSP